MTANLPIRVAVISRSPVVRLGLVSLIAQLHGRAIVTDSYEAGYVGHGECDAAVYDLGAAGNAEASAELEHLQRTGIPVISLVHDAGTGGRSLHGSAAVVTLAVTPDELFSALRRITDRSAPSGYSPLPSGLTEREFTVMACIAEGLSNQDIADRLYISVNSVKTYIRAAYRKIGVDNRPAAMLWGLKHGLAVDPEDRGPA